MVLGERTATEEKQPTAAVSPDEPLDLAEPVGSPDEPLDLAEPVEPGAVYYSPQEMPAGPSAAAAETREQSPPDLEEEPVLLGERLEEPASAPDRPQESEQGDAAWGLSDLEGYELFDIRAQLEKSGFAKKPATPRKAKRDILSLDSEAVQKELAAEEKTEPFIDEEALDDTFGDLGSSRRYAPRGNSEESGTGVPAGGALPPEATGGEAQAGFGGAEGGTEGEAAYADGGESFITAEESGTGYAAGGDAYAEGKEASPEEAGYLAEDMDPAQAPPAFEDQDIRQIVPVEFLLATLEHRARARRPGPRAPFLN
jgi:hypothetical protein